MKTIKDIVGFAKTLAGCYDNIEQSQGNPKNFARIHIYFRPLPWEFFNGIGFYSEQIYEYAPWEPYRQGVHSLEISDEIFIVKNYGFDNASRIAGAGKNPDLLKHLNKNTLTQRCGCSMHFRENLPGNYIGKVEPGKNCLVPRDGKITYLVSEVEVNKNQWISRDRGYDPKNDQQIWGSEHGKLVFKRIESYSNQIKVGQFNDETMGEWKPN